MVDPNTHETERRPLNVRQKRYVIWGWIAPAALGFIVASLLFSAGSGPGFLKKLMLGSATLSPGMGVALAALIAIGLPLIIFMWHRSMDEQEEHAVLWANTIALYFGIALWLSWWMLATTKLVPPLDPMSVILASCVVNVSYWLWKKFF